jgi:hypothetical protein
VRAPRGLGVERLSPSRLWRNRRRYINEWLLNPITGSDGAALSSRFRRVETAISSLLYSKYQDWAHPNRDVRELPVVINSFNRLDSLRSLIAWLERAGMRNIIVLDNGSTFPPLLAFYSTLRHEVVREQNLGPFALWASKALWPRIRSDYYIYSDSDVVPDECCPLDAIGVMFRTLQKYPFVEKVGFGLRIDDLPDCYEKKSDVIRWERRYWQKPISANLYRATIDTTFAVYRPRTMGGSWLRSLRTGGACVARHTPWYQDSRNLTEEELFYAKTAKRGISTWLERRGTFAE